MRAWLKLLLAWLSGALVLSGLWMFDEILTEAKYCGRDCLYPIPLLGLWSQYDAEGIVWVMIIAGLALAVVLKRD